MTTRELKLDLPATLVREAQAAGLLTPESIKQLLQDAIRRRAGEALIAAANHAARAGGESPTIDEIFEDVKAVSKARNKPRQTH